MLRTRRPLAIAAAAIAALLLASCGVDPGDGAATSTTSASSTDLTATQQQMADRMAEAYRGFGFSDEEATCLAEGLAGSLGPGADVTDLNGAMDTINECDIPMDRLMDIQGGMGDGTTDGALKESLAAGMRLNGLSDEEADCVAGAFVDEYGTDLEAMTDPAKLEPIAEDCGVDPSTIRPGG